MKYFTQPFRQLRGKLTLSYTLTTVVAFLLVEILIIGSGLTIFATHLQSFILADLTQKASQAAPYVANAARDPEPLATWLQITAGTEANQDPLHSHPIFLAITDTQGRGIPPACSHPPPPGAQIQTLPAPRNTGRPPPPRDT